VIKVDIKKLERQIFEDGGSMMRHKKDNLKVWNCQLYISCIILVQYRDFLALDSWPFLCQIIEQPVHTTYVCTCHASWTPASSELDMVRAVWIDQWSFLVGPSGTRIFVSFLMDVYCLSSYSNYIYICMQTAVIIK
jgi:hypothetical protein